MRSTPSETAEGESFRSRELVADLEFHFRTHFDTTSPIGQLDAVEHHRLAVFGFERAEAAMDVEFDDTAAYGRQQLSAHG